jgi:hypothetical protein
MAYCLPVFQFMNNLLDYDLISYGGSLLKIMLVKKNLI